MQDTKLFIDAILGEIWGYDGEEYEGGCLLGWIILPW
jgi:hypothetical protein